MRIVTISSEVLPVLGTVDLLGLWLFQQTDVEQRSEELQELNSATGVFQTYQSHNAIFNAINEITGHQPKSEQLRVFQIYNYELGLAAIENVLSASDKKGIPG